MSKEELFYDDVNEITLKEELELFYDDVNEITLKEELSDDKNILNDINEKFSESILVCVCDLTRGTIEKENLKLLEPYKDKICSKKVVFVLTKLNLFYNSFENILVNDSSIVLENYTPFQTKEDNLLLSANEIIKDHFVIPIKHSWPNAKIIFFDPKSKFYYDENSFSLSINGHNTSEISLLIESINEIDKINQTDFYNFLEIFNERLFQSTLQEIKDFIEKREYPYIIESLKQYIDYEKSRCIKEISNYFNHQFESDVEECFEKYNDKQSNEDKLLSSYKSAGQKLIESVSTDIQKKLVKFLEEEYKKSLNKLNRKILKSNSELPPPQDQSPNLEIKIPEQVSPNTTKEKLLTLTAVTGGIFAAFGLSSVVSPFATICLYYFSGYLYNFGKINYDKTSFKDYLKNQRDALKKKSSETIKKFLMNILNEIDSTLKDEMDSILKGESKRDKENKF